MLKIDWKPTYLGVVSKELSVELGFKLRIVKMRDQMGEELGKRTALRKTADMGAPRLEGTCI